jgi:hypothetical protein
LDGESPPGIAAGVGAGWVADREELFIAGRFSSETSTIDVGFPIEA